ncbi:MAG: ATP-binding protein [Anaerolineae bacterium]|nr:ATP-binding protein [Anaerolineae bacterium]
MTESRLETTEPITEIARLTFEQALAQYQTRKTAPEEPAAPVVSPPPAKPTHMLTDEELQRGILACNRCHGIGYYSLDVPVTDERFGKLIDCPDCIPFKTELRRREQFVRLTPLIAPYSLLRGALLEHEFSNFDRAATQTTDGLNPYDVARNWALAVIGKGEAPPWAYIYGDAGNGKTHLLAAAANGLARARVPLIFATMPDTLAMILDASMEMRETVIRYLQTVPVLLLDDFGTEKTTDWKVETTFRIINWRYTERRPTLFSSNIPPAYLPEIRISSRILDKAVCTVVFNQATNYREREVVERFKK